MNTLLKKIGLTCMVLAILLLTGAGFLNIQENVAPAAVVASTLVQNTNSARRSAADLGVLTRNSALDHAATLKANDMMQYQYFAHRSPSGITPWHWFKQANYTYLRAGENLAVHFTDSTELVDAWLNSPSHRANIMNAAYTEIGIGMATGIFEGVQTTFVVQLFGTPVPIAQQSASVAMIDGGQYRVISDTSDNPASEYATTERVPAPYKAQYIPISALIFMIGALFLMAHLCINCMRRSCIHLSLCTLIAILVLAMGVTLLTRTMFFSVV